MKVDSPLQISIRQQTMARVSCPAVGCSFPASTTHRPSAKGRSSLQGAEVPTACDRFKLHEGVVPGNFQESTWSNRLMLWLPLKGMPGKGPGSWEMAALPEQWPNI